MGLGTVISDLKDVPAVRRGQGGDAPVVHWRSRPPGSAFSSRIRVLRPRPEVSKAAVSPAGPATITTRFAAFISPALQGCRSGRAPGPRPPLSASIPPCRTAARVSPSRAVKGFPSTIKVRRRRSAKFVTQKYICKDCLYNKKLFSSTIGFFLQTNFELSIF